MLNNIFKHQIKSKLFYLISNLEIHKYKLFNEKEILFIFFYKKEKPNN